MIEEMDSAIFEVEQHIVAQGRYFAGRVGSCFFTALRDEKKILGITCAKCNLVLWPPRSTCGRCFSELRIEDMREIGPEGVLEAFTVVNYDELIHPRKAPFMYGIVRLDGASTGMPHFIDEVDHERVEIGMRVTAVFADSRKGHILDIRHFRPLK